MANLIYIRENQDGEYYLEITAPDGATVTPSKIHVTYADAVDAAAEAKENDEDVIVTQPMQIPEEMKEITMPDSPVAETDNSQIDDSPESL